MISRRRLILVYAHCFIFIYLSGSLFAQQRKSWKEIKTVADVCETYPEAMQSMLDAFNLDYPGLENVKKAYGSGNLLEAGTQLLDYYQKCDNAQHLRREQPEPSARTEAVADTTLRNIFIVQNVRGQVPFGDDGHRDWYYKGPNNDREWAWLSNRHSQINQVLSVYFETGNTKYVQYIDELLRDFIIKSMPYPEVKSHTSVWRGLEVAARAKVWSRIFYSLLDSEYLLPSTRLLMLSSLPDHAHYNRNFHGGNNWLTMEISALATVATNFPEFKKSEAWLDYSIESMVQSMKDQVYADGVQTELTSHYHNVSLRNFELFKNICDRANKPLPEFFNQTIEDMYSYIAHVVRPDGNRILNNDGDRGSDRDLILAGANRYNHPEWEYIVTNGASGTSPGDGPSYFYSWAGQMISRSGFEKDAHWSFFDVGPWGSGHQHNDKLHISISAFGRDLLVDAGRFAYTGEVAKKYRGYARGTQGHNTVLIDGKGQKPDVKVINNPLENEHWRITQDFDYAWNSFDKYYNLEGVKHNRSLIYVRGEFWVIVDKISVDQPREVQTLWHWHPTCNVKTERNGIIYSKNERGNLKVIPVNKIKWKVDVIEGQEEPEIQGWYSVEYNKYEPNKAVIHSTDVNGDKTFVWLLMPSEGKADKIEASITSEDDNGVDLEIKNRNKGTWKLVIPYSNSNDAQLNFKSAGS